MDEVPEDLARLMGESKNLYEDFASVREFIDRSLFIEDPARQAEWEALMSEVPEDLARLADEGGYLYQEFWVTRELMDTGLGSAELVAARRGEADARLQQQLFAALQAGRTHRVQVRPWETEEADGNITHRRRVVIDG